MSEASLPNAFQVVEGASCQRPRPMEMRATVAWQPAHDMMSPLIEGDLSLSKRIPKTSNDPYAICRWNPPEMTLFRVKQKNITVQSETYVIGCDR